MARNRRSKKNKPMSEENQTKDAAAETAEAVKETVEGEVTNEQATDRETTGEETPEVNEAPQLTAEQELEIQVKEANDKYLRLYSEFDNFRRRTAKEKLDLISTAGSEVLKSILPILDDFDRAFQNEDVVDDPEVMEGGFALIHKKLQSILEQKGLKVQAVAIGDSFDAEVHAAIAQIPATEEAQKGKIVDIIEKGYLLTKNAKTRKSRCS